MRLHLVDKTSKDIAVVTVVVVALLVKKKNNLWVLKSKSHTSDKIISAHHWPCFPFLGPSACIGITEDILQN